MNFILSLLLLGQVATCCGKEWPAGREDMICTANCNFAILSLESIETPLIISGGSPSPKAMILWPGVEASHCPGGAIIYGAGGDELFTVCPEKYKKEEKK